MKWDDLRVFLCVARQGRLQAAGAALGLDPATVARRIAALEEALKTQLFDRGQAGYALTGAGRDLLVHAEAMEAAAAAALSDPEREPDRLSGTVRIGAPDGVCNYLLLDACDALSRDNPDLQVQAVALPRIFSLSKREADVAITVAPPTAGRLTVRKIHDYRLQLYGRADLVASLGAIRSIEDTGRVRGIGYISDMIFDRELDYYALLGRAQEPAADLELADHAAALVPARLRPRDPARLHGERASRPRRRPARRGSPDARALSRAPPGRRARRPHQPYRRGRRRAHARGARARSSASAEAPSA